MTAVLSTTPLPAEDGAPDEARVALFMSGGKEASSLPPVLEAAGITIGLEHEMRRGTGFLEKITPETLRGHAALVIDLSGKSQPLPLIREIRERCPERVELVIIGRESDISFYRQSLFAGAREYFARPFPADELVHSLRRLLKLDPAPGAGRTGKCAAVLGTAGGCGSGLLAAGVAELLAVTHGRNTVVLDTDFSSPTIGCWLGSDLPGNFGMLLTETERLDKVLIEQIVQKPAENLALLDGYDGMGEKNAADPENIRKLIELWGNQYRYQVWRINGGAGAAGEAVLLQADIVLLVVAGTLPSARAARTARTWLGERNPSARLISVYNYQAPNPHVPPDVLQETSGKPFSYIVPYQRTLGAQMMKKTRFSDPSHCLHKIFEDISHDILGSPAVKKPWWRRMPPWR